MDFSAITLTDVSFVLAALIEILVPVILAIILWKKYKVSWAIFFLGMILFIVSLSRLPLNNLFAGYISSIQIPNSTIYIFAFASLTAAIFEEGFRVLGIGLIIRQKSYYKGLMYGAGHGGGGESMVFVGFSTVANYIFLRFLPGMVPGTDAGQFSSIEWFMPLLGAMERLFAIAIQIGLSVLVMHAFLNRKYYFIFLAVLFHFAVDMAAVYVNYSFGIWFSEAAVFLFAVLAVIIIVVLRPRYRPQHGSLP
jgi:uncharacterized membrane protein YhfC